MTRKAFFQKYFLRFAASLALVALIVYTLYHAFWNSAGSLGRDYVRLETDVQLLSGEAYLFRDEQVLTVPTPSVVNDLSESGKKVGKGVAVTEAWNGYAADEIAPTQLALDRINRLLAVVEKSLVVGSTTLSQAETYHAEAMQIYLSLRQAIANGSFDGAQALGDEMLTLFNRYAVITDGNADLRALQASLEYEREALLRGGRTVLTNTDASGYFYTAGCVDGYESLFTCAALDALTPASFAALQMAEPQTGGGFAVGKLAHSNRWYLAVPFDARAGDILEVDGSYAVSFPRNGQKTLTMTCERLLTDVDGSVIAIFASDEVPSDFSYLRVQTVEVEVGSYTGYNVPETAIHVVDGVEGVYIFEDSTVYFRRIEVLYRGDGYCIVAEQGERGDDYLALRDILVVSGEDLYDGRVYR